MELRRDGRGSFIFCALVCVKPGGDAMASRLETPVAGLRWPELRRDQAGDPAEQQDDCDLKEERDGGMDINH